MENFILSCLTCDEVHGCVRGNLRLRCNSCLERHGSELCLVSNKDVLTSHVYCSQECCDFHFADMIEEYMSLQETLTNV